MDKKKIINYVMHTPGNTNPNVLKGMLEESNDTGEWATVTFINNCAEIIELIGIGIFTVDNVPYFNCLDFSINNGYSITIKTIVNAGNTTTAFYTHGAETFKMTSSTGKTTITENNNILLLTGDDTVTFSDLPVENENE